MRPPLMELSESEFQELVALVNAVSVRAEAPHQDRLRQAG
jgi:hypothetical protein